ncbi:L-rhamnose mutarotase [Serratia ficaria]|uniref:L-rhamnose mutarotase n=1 Tax=Serratia ficaria TaxID=61651 RepID=UPI002183B4D2|nr:L-rhamnose mutarotase [Serratia ficaria]CAI2510674.1 L-rhamnose mutarotase [Serratia ficaria]
MIRKAFVMPVYSHAHAAYRQRHAAIWPELAQTLKQHGAHRYSIFLDARRHLLFAVVEIESEARWQAVADTDVCRRWWLSMRELMPGNPDNSPLSETLEPVFYLE